MHNEYRCFSSDFWRLCQKKGKDIMIIYATGEEKKYYSYEEVFYLVKRYLGIFKKNDMVEGDTIVSILPNSPEAIICFFAAAVGGINYAPAPCTVTYRELLNWLELTKPKMIIKKEGIAEYDIKPILCNCKCNGDFSWLSMEMGTFEQKSAANVYLMTSGTTGVPKAMSINIDKLWSSGIAFTEYYNIEESEYRFWNYLPMSYLGGLYNLALIPLCVKGSFVISEPFSGKTILNYWNFVRNNKVNALWMVPSIVQGLLKIEKIIGKKKSNERTYKIEIAFLGTAPIQWKMKQEFEEIFGIRLYENFALSESTFLTAEKEENIRFREEGSVGRVLPYVTLKLVPVKEHKNVNTLWIKSPYLFNGYLSADGMIEIELDQEGYFNTKDLGYINDDDVLVLCGRSRDIIKKGGLFISLVEIENVVKQLEFIEDVSAVPIKHDFYGESYVLCVIFKEKEDIEGQRERLHLWLLDNFVSYKMPDMIKIYDEFPKTMSGKIQKTIIARQIEKGND